MEKQERTPLVSICIPVYNGAATIQETLESVLRQTYRELEIIVVDNCSTDNTVALVQAMQDERITLYENDHNLGMAGNWNRCLEYVHAEYVQFVCADDIIMPECIEKRLAMMLEDAEIGMVFSASVVVDAAGNVRLRRHAYPGNRVVDGMQLARKSYRSKNLYGEPTNVMLRMDAVRRAGDFALNTYYATDWDMWLRVSATGKVGYVNRELMQYRVSAANETSKLPIRRICKDDSMMMQNLRQSGCMRMTLWDDMIHVGMNRMRLLARILFMKMIAH